MSAYYRARCGLPAGLHRGPAGRERLGRLEDPHRLHRRQGAAGGRRPLRRNPSILQRGIDTKTANSLLVKVNQIGSLTETLDAVSLAQRAGTPPSPRTAPAKPRTPPSPTSRWPPTPARSRPAPRPSRRYAKYNQLLRIEEELDDAARYAGRSAFPRFKVVAAPAYSTVAMVERP